MPERAFGMIGYAERVSAGRASLGAEPACCLVISHYNAWPTDQLVALLDQTLEIPADDRFHTRVVVNQARPVPLLLPGRHEHVEVHYRPNLGYNIGAWDHGWRVGRPFDFYLFLQEECVILRPGWMRRFRKLASAPGVGLVGESLVDKVAWSRLIGDSTGIRRLLDYPLKGGCEREWHEQLRGVAEGKGIDLGRDGSHLQSLIFATRRDVLERIDGFEADATEYVRAVVSEVLASKAVLTQGLAIRQAGLLPFSIISHPQWMRPLWRRLLEVLVLSRIPPRLRWFAYLAACSLRARAARLLQGRREVVAR